MASPAPASSEPDVGLEGHNSPASASSVLQPPQPPGWSKAFNSLLTQRELKLAKLREERERLEQELQTTARRLENMKVIQALMERSSASQEEEEAEQQLPDAAQCAEGQHDPKKPRVQPEEYSSRKGRLVCLEPVLFEDHLLPFLSISEVARLSLTCKALQAVALERIREVGHVALGYLAQAMKFCPRAKCVMVHVRDDEVQDSHKTAISECLLQFGKDIERLSFWIDKRGTTNKTKLLSLAVANVKQEKGLPNLRSLTLPMLVTEQATGPGSLMDLLQDIEDLTLTERAGPAVLYTLLQAVGQAPRLRRLTLQGLCRSQRGIPDFIPPTLKELSFDAPTWTQGNELGLVTEAMVKSLQKNRAQLEVVVMPRPRSDLEPGAEGMVAGEETFVTLVKLLAPSVQTLRLILPEGRSTLATELCSCERLTSLETTAAIFEGNKDITPFFRLTKLVLRSCSITEPGLWRCMRDKFPALESLTLHLKMDVFASHGKEVTELVRSRLVNALKAMKQTLRVLVIKGENGTCPPVVVPEVFQALGEAIAKLPGLQTLYLRGLYSKGFQAYDAVAQGMGSGSEGCPHLKHLILQARNRNSMSMSSMKSLYSGARSSPLTLTILDNLSWGQHGAEELMDLALELVAEGFMGAKVQRLELADDPDDKGRSAEDGEQQQRAACIQFLRELLGTKFAMTQV